MKKFKGRFLFDNTTTRRFKRNVTKGWTLVVTFSRPWCVRPFFNNLEKMEFDRSKCHLLIYNNTNDVYLDRALRQYVNRYRQWHKQKYGPRKLFPPFASVRHYKSYRPYGGIVFGQQISFESSKLPTILEMHRDIAKMITTKYFFLIEDDTLPPGWAVYRLFKILKKSSKTGLVSGVETTRTPRLADSVRLGVYKLLRNGNQIIERLSLDPRLRGVQEVDATGFYCLAARTEAWKKGFEIFENEIEGQLTAEPNWAIDTLLTNDVKRAGYKIYADFETPCYHMQQVGDRIYYWAIDRAVPKLDIYIEKYKCYATGVNIPWK